ncbi:endonuclease/exonuclease/phosphatase family protein [uncultured Photobacterium sp.]|uniref:endonuclease/exonuclease/phosphatase family protein n=1 Tax=uncultured Photobacterium sp. TaxID=173973 RepID=UPI0026174DEF|nr:endonuclease/exonuclease/phosphatase family protein [uncultured Photobacterium sp.]
MPQDNVLTASKPDIIKIATFNLFNYLEPPFAFYDFDNIYDSEQWQKKQRWICDYLSEYQPDVVGFQEVFSPESLRELVKKQGYPYFAVIDEATLISDYIYQSPVVAIASRYPIQSVAPVTANPELSSLMGLSDNFCFSRKPLRASVELPNLGLCDCYVVHFKSKRPTIENEDSNDANIVKAIITEVTGSWASSVQRGSEAALLLSAIIERREQTGYPALLMGDFNDDLKNGVLQHLLTKTVRGKSQANSNELLAPYLLKDSWTLFQSTRLFEINQQTSSPEIGTVDNSHVLPRRPYSHYYGSKGSVIDYILISSEFDPEYQESLAEVVDYHTYDRHLLNPVYERDSQSTDHAIIMVSLKLRS